MMVQSIPLINIGKPRVEKIDFDSEGIRRNDILNKFKEVYGSDRIAGVATFGTEKSKSAIQTACLKPGTLINTNTGLKSLLFTLINSVIVILSECSVGDSKWTP